MRPSGSLSNLSKSPYLPANNKFLVPKKVVDCFIFQRSKSLSIFHSQRVVSTSHANHRRNLSSSEDEDIEHLARKNPPPSRPPKPVRASQQIRKVKSMHELRKESKKSEHAISSDEDEVHPQQAQPPPPQVNMADKIDSFLDAVNKQQAALNKMLEARKTRGFSRMSSVTSTNPQVKPRLRPAPRVTRDLSLSAKPPLTRTSTIDASKVGSKLKNDRNYQPPRRKVHLTPNAKKELKRQPKIAVTDNEDEYENDFEAEEDDNVSAKHKEEWLFDQAIRGRARQKAAEALRGQHKIFQEKESSKDSAYGFSGGENSRLHTREPTPDTNNSQLQPRITVNHYHGRLSRGPPPPVCQNPSLRKQFNRFSPSSSRPVRPTVTMSSDKAGLVDVNDTNKVEFLNLVTREILRRGHFTEKGIKRALESQLCNHNMTALSVTQKTDLINKLKENFGLTDQKQHKKLSSSLDSRSSSHSSDDKVDTKITPPQIVTDEDHDDDLSSIFKDESDSDVVNIVKSVMRPYSSRKYERPKSAKVVVKDRDDDQVPRLKLPLASRNDDLFNITNLNVSFNSAKMHEAKRRLEESRTQALLVKSFAYKNDGSKDSSDNGSILSKRESSDAEDDQEMLGTPRSSNLYHTDSDHNDDDDDIVSEAHSISRSNSSASVVEEEDIPEGQ